MALEILAKTNVECRPLHVNFGHGVVIVGRGLVTGCEQLDADFLLFSPLLKSCPSVEGVDGQKVVIVFE